MDTRKTAVEIQCPKCRCKRGILVARDTKSTRKCHCGHTWLPEYDVALQDSAE